MKKILFGMISIFTILSGILSIKFFSLLVDNFIGKIVISIIAIIIQILGHYFITQAFYYNKKNKKIEINKFDFIIYIVIIIINMLGTIAFFMDSELKNEDKEIKASNYYKIRTEQLKILQDSNKNYNNTQNKFYKELNNINEEKEKNEIKQKYTKLIKEKENFYNNQIEIKRKMNYITTDGGVYDLTQEKNNIISSLNNEMKQEINKLTNNIKDKRKEYNEEIKSLDIKKNKVNKNITELTSKINNKNNTAAQTNDLNKILSLLVAIMLEIIINKVSFNLFVKENYNPFIKKEFAPQIKEGQNNIEENNLKEKNKTSIISIEKKVCKKNDNNKNIKEQEDIFDFDQYLQTKKNKEITYKTIKYDLENQYNIIFSTRKISMELKNRNIYPKSIVNGYKIFLI